MNEDYEIIASDFKEIIPKPRNWMFVWGITAVAFTLFLMILASIVIPYNQNLDCRIEFLNAHDAEYVKSPANGYIKRINTKNTQMVMQKQLIAEIYSKDNRQMVVATAENSGLYSVANKPLSVGTPIKEGDTIGLIIPNITDDNAIYCLTTANAFDLSKISIGNTVNIYVERYRQEHVINGKVLSKSMAPTKDGLYPIFIRIEKEDVERLANDNIFLIGMNATGFITYKKSTIFKEIFGKFI